MRSKEEAHDYRYFPDPDLPPLVIDDSVLNQARSSLPELPDARRARFINEYGLGDTDAAIACIKAVMEGAAQPLLDLKVPLIVEAGTGDSWAEAH